MTTAHTSHAAAGARTILVTGAAGFIGSHACEALLARGFRAIGVDRCPNRWSEVVAAHTVIADLLDEDALQARLPADIDLIVHLAANPRVCGAECVCDEATVNRSRGNPAFLSNRRATSSTIGAQTPQLSTVTSTAGGPVFSEIASALAHRGWATPVDSVCRDA